MFQTLNTYTVGIAGGSKEGRGHQVCKKIHPKRGKGVKDFRRGEGN